jgi:hypothetical protein
MAGNKVKRFYSEAANNCEVKSIARSFGRERVTFHDSFRQPQPHPIGMRWWEW